MRIALVSFLAISWWGCSSSKTINIPPRPNNAITGSEFYRIAAGYDWKLRDSLVVQEVLQGNLPAYMKKFVPVHMYSTDARGKTITVTFYVSSDYLTIGSNADHARIDITPMAAQRIADSFHCFLPTRKIVDAIYKAAKVKLTPVPMYAFRDSTVTMYQHDLIIEGQRKLRKGLIAGIKKDIVISGDIVKNGKPDRVAIYGWHKADGDPIQPLYTGHVNWYVDYSHGIRLVYRDVYINGKRMDYIDVLKNATFRILLGDDADGNFYRYPY